MAKVNSLVSLVLMSIVTAVRFTISQLAAFNRVTSIGGGLWGITTIPAERHAFVTMPSTVHANAYYGSC